MKNGKILLLALGHGLNDCIAGIFPGSLLLLPMTIKQVPFLLTIIVVMLLFCNYYQQCKHRLPA